MANERWAQIVIRRRKTSYDISDQGNVRNRRTGKAVQAKVFAGRRYIGIFIAEKNRRHFFRASTLVAKAFLPPKPGPKFTIEHKNQNKRDDRAKNLAWMTLSENIRRSFQLTNRSRITINRYLSPAAYETIRELWATGKYSQVRIGKATGLTNGMVSRIVNGLAEPREHGTIDVTVDWDVLNYTRPKFTPPNRLLTDEQVLEIARLRGKESAPDVAARFGVKQRYVENLWYLPHSRAVKLLQKLAG
jgi:hypothetical protein